MLVSRLILQKVKLAIDYSLASIRGDRSMTVTCACRVALFEARTDCYATAFMALKSQAGPPLEWSAYRVLRTMTQGR